jgi:two-component system, sensor histidine kinase and response regulator
MWKYSKSKRLFDLHSFRKTLGILIIFIALVTTIGWLTNTSLFMNLLPGHAPMPRENSVLFLIYGLFLALGIEKLNKGPLKKVIITIYLLFALYSLILFLGYYFDPFESFINYIFPLKERSGYHPIKHLSPYASILFTFCGTAVIFKLLNGKKLLINNIIGFLGAVVTFTGFVSALGYMYGTPVFYSENVLPLALRTSILFILLGSGIIISAGEDTLYLRYFMGSTANARLLRITIPMLVIIVFLQGALHVILTNLFKLNEALILANLTLLTILIGSIVVVYLTRVIFKSANDAELERLHALKELRKVNSLQSLVLQNSSLGIYIVNNLTFQWVNPRLEDIFRIPVKDFQGSSLKLILPTEDLFGLQKSWDIAIAEGKTVDTAIQIHRGDGELFWCRFIGVALNPDKPFEGSIWMIEDITERKKLRERMRLLSHTIESLSECISITDKSDIIVFVNETFLKTYGYTQDELIGKHISIVSSSDNDPRIVKSILWETQKDGWKGELINKRKDGSQFPISLSSSKVIDDNGEVVALVGVANDITERRKSEQQVKEYADNLKKANDAKDKLFSIISHDLRSPFGSILMFLKILTEQYDEFTENEKKSIFAELRKTSEKTFDLLENLLKWSRSQTGGIKVKTVKIDLSEVSKKQIGFLNDTAIAKKIILSSQIPSGILVLADREMIKTVLLNLTSNAIKFTHPGGKVIIDARVVGDSANIIIEDNGIGLSPDEIENLFKTDKSRSTLGTMNEKGTGLGLLICKEFVEKNKGKLWVESELNKGSRFIFSLPLANTN